MRVVLVFVLDPVAFHDVLVSSYQRYLPRRRLGNSKIAIRLRCNFVTVNSCLPNGISKILAADDERSVTFKNIWRSTSKF